MKTQVLKAIERFGLLENAKNITVALSGGADSMALLGVLLQIREEFGLNVSAAHFNHMIRGEEAERDEEFVKAECKKRGVELFVGRGDVPLYARSNKISTELAARKLRYEFLNSVSKGLIATAHTASDNLETVIFNLARGSSIDGLCGIPPKRDNIIRPLILSSRKQIEEYCEENSIPYVTDSTNSSCEYTRNHIRHNIIPLLKEINPSIESAVLKSSNLLREDAEFLSETAETFLKENIKEDYLSLEGFDELPVSIGKRVIRRFIEDREDITLENIHIEEAYNIALNGGKSNLPKDKFAVCKRGKLSIEEKTAEYPEKTVKITECDNKFFENTQKVNNLFLNYSIDCDKIVGKWNIRTRLAGDSIRLKGRGCTKQMNRLLSEEGIPVSERDSLPVIADEKGVIWIHKIGVAERCAVTKNSKRVYIIEVL